MGYSYALYHLKESLHITLNILLISREKFASYRMKIWLLQHEKYASNRCEKFVSCRTNNSLPIARTFSLISIISSQIASKMCHITPKIRFISQEQIRFKSKLFYKYSDYIFADNRGNFLRYVKFNCWIRS